MNPALRAHLHVAANTHPGMKGKNNEDRYAVTVHRLGAKKEIPSLLAVVCDGIGGHRAGEVAAEIAVETISKTIAESNGTEPIPALRQAIQQASAAIRAQAEANPERQGMGATCVCAWVIGEHLYSASVGDSRLYLIRGDQIRQLTTDHTWVQEAVEFGALTPEQARRHPNAHVIRRYLGSPTLAEPDFRLRLHPEETDEQAEANQGLRLQPGDFMVLCSDGLTDLVEKEEILSALKSYPRDKAVQRLINLANERGGHDNITIIALEAPGNLAALARGASKAAASAHSVRRLALPCLVIGGLVTALFLVALIAFWVVGGAWLERKTTPTAILTTPTVLSTSTVVQSTATLEVFSSATQSAPPAKEESVTPAAMPSVTNAQGPQAATYTPWPTNTQSPTPTLTVTSQQPDASVP